MARRCDRATRSICDHARVHLLQAAEGTKDFHTQGAQDRTRPEKGGFVGGGKGCGKGGGVGGGWLVEQRIN